MSDWSDERAVGEKFRKLRPNPTPVWILYKNWRDKTEWRYVMPVRLWYGRTQHHPKDQWFIDATDLKKNVPRSFAMKDIARWQAETPLGETTP